MEAKFLDLDRGLPFALSNDGRKLRGTVLFLSAITHRKVINVNFLLLFPLYLLDHGLFRSRNFATMATLVNDFSSLFLLEVSKM